jgi:hypothetical protein
MVCGLEIDGVAGRVKSRGGLSLASRVVCIDPLFDMVAKVADQPLHGPSDRITQGTNGVALDLRCDVE